MEVSKATIERYKRINIMIHKYMKINSVVELHSEENTELIRELTRELMVMEITLTSALAKSFTVDMYSDENIVETCVTTLERINGKR